MSSGCSSNFPAVDPDGIATPIPALCFRRTAKVAVGYEAMHFFVGGKEFTQPDSAAAYSRGQFDEVVHFP